MQLWVGLGNPGAQYAMHRHNVGYMVIDALEEVHDFPAPKQKFQGWAMEGRLGQRENIVAQASHLYERERSQCSGRRWISINWNRKM